MNLFQMLMVPGVLLMRHWRLPAKLMLLFVAALLPTAWLGWKPQGWTGAAIGIGVFAYLMLALMRASTGSMRAVGRSLAVLADGNLSTEVDVRGSDEFADMGRELDRMTRSLSAMVTAVRRSAGIRISATSVSGSEPTNSACSVRPSLSVIETSSAPSITW